MSRLLTAQVSTAGGSIGKRRLCSGLWSVLVVLLSSAACTPTDSYPSEVVDAVAGQASLATENRLLYPLLDGRCDEYGDLDVVTHEPGEDVTLFVFQDPSYVWLCYTVPPESYGTLDLFLLSPNVPELLDLHVSAQVGEWRDGVGEETPQTPTSDLWWRNRGWAANPIWLNGLDMDADPPTARFRPSEGREIQMSKDRFGRGEWQLRFNIRGVPEGTIDFPLGEDGEPTSMTLMAN